MSSRDNLFDALMESHDVFPVYDRTNLFSCLSLVSITICLLIAYLIIRSKFKVRFPLLIKLILLLVLSNVLFFVSFSYREIEVVCTSCQVNYYYEDFRLFGKRIHAGNFKTSCNPEEILSKRVRDFRCFHCYRDQQRVRYWGGLIPTLEYFHGEIIFLRGDLPDKPYIIDRSMKLKDAKDDIGWNYYKVELNEPTSP